MTTIDCSSERNEGASDDVPPYSFLFELRFFFGKGLTLGLSSLLNWGIPPLLAMAFAGHVHESGHLQSSLGYGRVWFNCTILMPTFGMMSYFNTVIPGCIGAKREDRIALYTHRSMVLVFMGMLPLYACQMFAGNIMQSLGAPPDNAVEVSAFCRLMLINAVLLIPSCHFESTIINLGFAKCAALNSFITGLVIDVACTYTFVFLLEWGVHGAALAQIVVQISRLFVWVIMLLFCGIFRKCIIPPRDSERLLPTKEIRIFVELAIPQILSFFAGWAIFEFQMIAVTNIRYIERAALAAGSVWVQIEQSLASAQDGWIRSTNMRTLNLLGKRDPGAGRAFLIFNVLSVGVVIISNVPFVVYQRQLCELVSNDIEVQNRMLQILWVLVTHTISRVAFINLIMLFVPLGRGMLGTWLTFVSFYLFATPVAVATALTDLVTTSVALKMVACVGATTLGQTFGGLWGFLWHWKLDWAEAGAIINERANTDREKQEQEKHLGTTLLAT
eukprot:TRINITY_DN20967_c0_g1_i1.p1 TRINITY_DN20967_c0_g1~~TRINITY_DN20967_c0_g1_i1.p1  ORF type:complete len:502 (+),score=57.91 TRINITY_DN20967_c0_g1_i1:85-1590(+)